MFMRGSAFEIFKPLFDMLYITYLPYSVPFNRLAPDLRLLLRSNPYVILHRESLLQDYHIGYQLF